MLSRFNWPKIWKYYGMHAAKKDSASLEEPTELNPPTSKVTTEDPELAERFYRVLNETVEAMEESKLRYAFIGGVASGGLGRPRSTHDIDLFVMPDDAELALRALSKRNFKTQKTDPTWLYKAFKEDILVDVIFKSKGEIYFDTEMYSRILTADFHGKKLRLVAPEDLVIIKAAAHSEITPNHWHDAIALLMHSDLDWEYLLRRAKRAPRRILSLLLYAQSNDIWVPNSVIMDLYRVIFENSAPRKAVVPAAIPAKMPTPPAAGAEIYSHPAYHVAHLKEKLAKDGRTHELDIKIEYSGSKLLLRGDVMTQDRKAAVEQLVRETLPHFLVENQIRILQCSSPSETEEVVGPRSDK